jgi:hypothetical protein
MKIVVQKTYEIDTICNQLDFSPLSSQPIQINLAKVKSYVAERNNCFKIAEVEMQAGETVAIIASEACEVCGEVATRGL